MDDLVIRLQKVEDKMKLFNEVIVEAEFELEELDFERDTLISQLEDIGIDYEEYEAYENK